MIIYYIKIIASYKTKKTFNYFNNKDYMIFIHQSNFAYKLFSIQLFLKQILSKIYNIL